MNVAYFGSPELSSKLLMKILENEDVNVRLVVTQPDKPKGKRLAIEPCPVKKIAIENNIHVFDMVLKNNVGELLNALELYKIDIAVLFAYGAIIPSSILESPKYGFLNVHPSLLPKYRGASPTVFPFLLGDEKTGVTLMQMNPRLDEGPIIKQDIFTISSLASREIFENQVPDVAYTQIIKTLKELAIGKIQSTNQNHEQSTYTRTLKKEDGFIERSLLIKAIKGSHIDSFDSLPKIMQWYLSRNNLNINQLPTTKSSQIICNMIRALYPWPGVWTIFNTPKNEPKRLKILDCESVGDFLKINYVQIEGKNKIKYSDFIKTYSL